MELDLINIFTNVIMVGIVGGFVRYHMNKLKEIEKTVQKLMTRDEIRLYVRDMVADKFSHIEYVLAEIKIDMAEIKETLQKEKPL